MNLFSSLLLVDKIFSKIIIQMLKATKGKREKERLIEREVYWDQ